MQAAGPDATPDFPRLKSNKVLPSGKISFPRHLEVLRAWANLSGVQNVVANNENVASIVGMSASTLSLLNPFFKDVGFLVKNGNRYWPSSEVLQFNQRYEEGSHDGAAQVLAPLLSKTWFARALLAHLAREPMEETAAIRLLAETASTSPNHQIVLLIDYLAAAGGIERESGQLRLAGPFLALEPQPVIPPIEVKGPPVVPHPPTGAIKVRIDVNWDELMTWEDARLAEFFNAVRQLARGLKSGQALIADGSGCLSEAEAAERLNTSTRTIRRLVKRGKLQRRMRQMPGRRPEAVYDPGELDASVEAGLPVRMRLLPANGSAEKDGARTA